MKEKDEHWWLEEEDEIARCALTRVKEIENQLAGRFHELDTLTKLYQGKSSVQITDTDVLEGDDRIEHEGRTGAVPRFNLVRSVIDAWVSIVAAQRPRPKMLTTGGGWKEQALATDLDKFLRGALYQSGMEDLFAEVVTDGAVYGTGVLRMYEEEGVLKLRRLQPTQLLVDELLSPAGEEPCEVFIRTPEHVASLCYKYPDLKEEILKTPGFSSGGRQRMVYEGWYVDGDRPVRVKFVGDVLLEIEDWDVGVLPFLFYRPQNPRGGFFGIGLAESLKGNQMRIEEIQSFIAEVQRRVVRPRLLTDMPVGSVQAAASVNGVDQGFDVISVQGGKSFEFYTPTGLPPEIYGELARIAEYAKEEVGVSSYSTANSLPAGVDSAPAQREFNLRENRRHGLASGKAERMLVEWGEKTVKLYAWMSKGRKVAVKYADRNVVQQIEWPKVNLDKLAYVISIEAASMASLSPAGRIQAATELAQAGILLGQEELRNLIGNPDLDASQKYSIAAFDRFSLKMVNLLEQGMMVSPDPLIPVAVQKGKAQAAYAEAICAGAPDEIVDNLSRFVNECLALEAQMAPPPAMDEGMPTPQLSRAAAQGLDTPFSSGGQSSQGI